MEIKFRGFSIENNCWIHGFYHEVEVEGIKNAYIFWQGESWNVDIKSVGMFTGKYDKNKVEIYTRDIVRTNDYSKGASLTHKQPTIIYIIPMPDNLFDGIKLLGLGLGAWCSRTSGYTEVIGNTYENSNLIN